MKIKLAILDGDGNYLEKMRSAFVRRYSEEIEFYLFTSKSAALKALEESRFDLLLVNKNMEVTAQEIPENCLYAYLSDTRSDDGEYPVICKFQRMDLLYGQITQVLKENRDKTRGVKAVSRGGRIILFCGAGGGVGTSSAAAACAVRLAQGRKVAYLNLEQLGGADLYFSGEGRKTMTDLVCALGDPAVNLREQLKSGVRTDDSGVSFFAQARNPLDMQEMGAGGMLRLISELKDTGDYDDIVLDMDLSLDRAMLPVYAMADRIVLVGDGSRSSAVKAERAVNALRILDDSSDNPVVNRICRIYNRVDGAQNVNRTDIPVLGLIGTCKTAEEREIVHTLAAMELFGGLL